MAGTRGPVPKRKGVLSGHRSRDELDQRTVTAVSSSAAVALKSPAPSGSSTWHDTARRLWRAIAASHQASLFEPSDWARGKLAMTSLSAYLATPRRNSQLLVAVLDDLERLMVAEGHRRRVGVELEPREQPAKQPSAAKGWSKDVRALWRSMAKSEQSRYYEPSDWEYARFLLTELSLIEQSGAPSGQLSASVSRGLTALLLTEVDRRRLRMDTAPAAEGPAGATAGELEAAAVAARLSQRFPGRPDLKLVS